MSEEQIKACPFCGGNVSTTGKIKYCDSHQAWWKDGTRVLVAYFCNCMRCGITNQGLLGHQTQHLAIQHWNKRAGGRKSAVSKTPEPSTLASATGSAAGATVIESTGEVDGCDATAQTISVKISMRPSGVRLGDACWLKWQRHPLTPNSYSTT